MNSIYIYNFIKVCFLMMYITFNSLFEIEFHLFMYMYLLFHCFQQCYVPVIKNCVLCSCNYTFYNHNQNHHIHLHNDNDLPFFFHYFLSNWNLDGKYRKSNCPFNWIISFDMDVYQLCVSSCYL